MSSSPNQTFIEPSHNDERPYVENNQIGPVRLDEPQNWFEENDDTAPGGAQQYGMASGPENESDLNPLFDLNADEVFRETSFENNVNLGLFTGDRLNGFMNPFDQQSVAPPVNMWDQQLSPNQQPGSVQYWQGHGGPMTTSAAYNTMQGLTTNQNALGMMNGGFPPSPCGHGNPHQMSYGNVGPQYQGMFGQGLNHYGQQVPMGMYQNGDNPNQNGAHQMSSPEPQGPNEYLSHGHQSTPPPMNISSSPAPIIQAGTPLQKSNMTDYSIPFVSSKPAKARKTFSKKETEGWDNYQGTVREFFTSPFPEYCTNPEEPNDFLPAVIPWKMLSPAQMMDWFARAPQHRDLLDQFIVPRLTGYPGWEPNHTPEMKKKLVKNNSLSMRNQRHRESNSQFMSDCKILRTPKGGSGKQLTKIFVDGLLPGLSGAGLLHGTNGVIDKTTWKVTTTFSSGGLNGNYTFDLQKPMAIPLKLAKQLTEAGYEEPNLHDYLRQHEDVWAKFYPKYYNNGKQLPPIEENRRQQRFVQSRGKKVDASQPANGVARGTKRSHPTETANQPAAFGPNGMQNLTLPTNQDREANHEHGNKKRRIDPPAEQNTDLTMAAPTHLHERVFALPQKSKAPTYTEYRQRQVEAPRDEQFERNVNHHFGNAVAQATVDEQARQQNQLLINEAHRAMPSYAPIHTIVSRQNNASNVLVKKLRHGRVRSGPDEVFDILTLHGAGRRAIGSDRKAATMSQTPELHQSHNENFDDSGFVEGNSFEVNRSDFSNLPGNDMNMSQPGPQSQNAEAPSTQGHTQESQPLVDFDQNFFVDNEFGGGVEFEEYAYDPFKRVAPEIGVELPTPQDGLELAPGEEGCKSNGQVQNLDPNVQFQTQVPQPDSMTDTQTHEAEQDDAVVGADPYSQPTYAQDSEPQKENTQQTSIGGSDDNEIMAASLLAFNNQRGPSNSVAAISHDPFWNKLNDHTTNCPVGLHGGCARCREYERHDITKTARVLAQQEDEL